MLFCFLIVQEILFIYWAFFALFCLFVFWGHTACGILVPRPGIELVPPAVEAWSFNLRTAREVPVRDFL